MLTEHEIVNEMSDKLLYFLPDNIAFDLTLKKYKNLFEGSMNDFLDCFIYFKSDTSYYNRNPFSFSYKGIDEKLKERLLNIKNTINKSNISNIHIGEITKEKDSNLWDKLTLIHFLDKYGLLRLNTLHQDNTKIADVISFLSGNSSESIRQKLSTVRKNDFRPNVIYLQNILPMAKILGHNGMIQDIQKRIDNA